jgi:hypothetical protein
MLPYHPLALSLESRVGALSPLFQFNSKQELSQSLEVSKSLVKRGGAFHSEFLRIMKLRLIKTMSVGRCQLILYI